MAGEWPQRGRRVHASLIRGSVAGLAAGMNMAGVEMRASLETRARKISRPAGHAEIYLTGRPSGTTAVTLRFDTLCSDMYESLLRLPPYMM